MIRPFDPDSSVMRGVGGFGTPRAVDDYRNCSTRIFFIIDSSILEVCIFLPTPVVSAGKFFLSWFILREKSQFCALILA